MVGFIPLSALERDTPIWPTGLNCFSIFVNQTRHVEAKVELWNAKLNSEVRTKHSILKIRLREGIIKFTE